MLSVARFVFKMTKREKFYFKKKHPNSENRTFMILYNFIEKNPNITIQKLKENFAAAPFYSSISVELNSLYQKLLASIKVYRISSKEAIYVIQKNLSYIIILLEKDEKQQALKLLIKTKKMAYQHEEFAYVVKLISLEEKLKYKLADSNITAKLKELNTERLEVIEEQFRINQLKILRLEFLNLFFKKGIRILNPSSFDFLKNTISIDQDEYTTSLSGQKLFLDCKAMYSLFNGQPKISSEYYHQNFKMIYNNPQVFSALEKVSAFRSYLFTIIDTGDYNLFYQVKNKYILKFKDDVSTKVFTTYLDHYLMLRMELKMNNVDKLKPILDEAKNKFENLDKTKLSPSQKNVIFFQTTYAYVTIREFDIALEFIHKWDNEIVEEFSNIRRRILKMLIYFEQKRYRLLNSEVNSFAKILISRNAQNEFFSYLLKYFRAIIKDPAQKIDLQSNFYLEVLKYSKLEKFQSYFKEIHFHYWAKQSMEHNPK